MYAPVAAIQSTTLPRNSRCKIAKHVECWIAAARTNDAAPESAKSQEQKPSRRHITFPPNALEKRSMLAIIARNETIEARLWIFAESGNAPPSIGKIAATNTPVDHTINRVTPERQPALALPNKDSPRESANEPTDRATKAKV